MPLDARWLNPEQAAELIGYNRSTIFKMLKDGRLSSVKTFRPGPRRLYFWRPDLEAWIERGGVAPNTDKD